jgi:iron complex outermembrane receptor protein
MSASPFRFSLIALALAQACTFASSASAQSDDKVLPAVTVTAAPDTTGRAATASVGGFSDTPLQETPASISVITQQQMQDRGIRSTTAAVETDASVNDSYNAVGYAEQFSIRGFELENETSFRKDGLSFSGASSVPLENKERIEVLKGISGLQAGVSTPGGIINYVTKRPTDTPLRTITTAISERGTLYGAVDLGGRFADPRFGYRINAAAADLHPYVRGANGDRQFVSAAFDWQVSPDALLQLDMDYQRKSQITAPGFQLIRNEVLPTGVSAKMLLNDQPWTRPVETWDTNLGLRFEYKLAPGWLATVAANKHWFRRNDFTAFPYGCSNEGAGFYPGYCSNGDYDVYDYQSTGERKTPWGVQAKVHGNFATGELRHELTVGASFDERHDSFGDYVYDFVGYSNLWHPLVTPHVAADRVTGPVSERRSDRESALFGQDIVNLTPDLALHAGLRAVQVKRSEFVDATTGFVHSDQSFALPSLALVQGVAPGWNVYGSFSQGLQHGGIAPMQTTNQNQVLEPARSHQVEIGTKGAVGDTLALSAALFQIRQGLEYTDASNTYVRNGRETHRGLEVSAAGRATPELNWNLSLMALNTRQDGTGQADLDGKRVTDVPAFKSSAWAEYAVPGVAGLKVDGNWTYSGKKAFDVENSVFVPGYHVFGLGASYGMNMGLTHVTVRARVDNLFDKFYWGDVTPELGGYLIPGAPRTFRLSAQLDF